MTDYAVVNPYTGVEESSYALTTPEQLAGLLDAADDARTSWARATTVAERADAVRGAARLHEERADELARTVVREMGKPLAQALAEVELSAAIYRYYADHAAELLADEPIATADGATAFVRKSPLGVVLGVMPWNFPLYQVARFAAPGLVLGNPLLLKHAPQCPESALAVQRILRDAGLPDGAYGNLFVTDEQVAELVGDPRVRGVSLTGSERAGAAVAAVAGRHLKKVVLELGGSDPFIVLGSDDLGATVAAGVAARLDNNGQACNAAKRFIVVDELYDDFARLLVEALAPVVPGDPLEEGVVLGPLSSEAAAARLDEQVRRAVAQGATVLLRGPREGTRFAPVVLADIAPSSDAFEEEFFGPVVQLYRVGSEEEALAVANASPFGLGSYVFTPDVEQALRVADRLEAGMVFVNEVGADSAELPFGGVKRSGTGRELGRAGIEEFMNKKLVRLPA